MNFPDYYGTLGLPFGASETEIKQAYRKLSKKFHPDLNDSEKYYEELFKKVQEAYEVLTDPNRREHYDERLKANNRKQSRSEEPEFTQPSSEKSGRGSHPNGDNSKKAEQNKSNSANNERKMSFLKFSGTISTIVFLVILGLVRLYVNRDIKQHEANISDRKSNSRFAPAQNIEQRTGTVEKPNSINESSEISSDVSGIVRSRSICINIYDGQINAERRVRTLAKQGVSTFAVKVGSTYRVAIEVQVKDKDSIPMLDSFRRRFNPQGTAFIGGYSAIVFRANDIVDNPVTEKFLAQFIYKPATFLEPNSEVDIDYFNRHRRDFDDPTIYEALILDVDREYGGDPSGSPVSAIKILIGRPVRLDESEKAGSEPTFKANEIVWVKYAPLNSKSILAQQKLFESILIPNNKVDLAIVWEGGNHAGIHELSYLKRAREITESSLPKDSH